MAQEADYVIVDGGTSGLVVIHKLSEDPDVSIIMLKAGEDLRADLRVNIPGFWTKVLASEADWKFKTVSQQQSLPENQALTRPSRGCKVE
jgi:choline dehydrogenase-like flavoprotein